MSWSDVGAIRETLQAALSSYNWEKAGELGRKIVRKTQEERTPCPTDEANKILAALRGKRRFEITTRVAEAFVFSGQDAPRILRQYAQALIDSGLLLAAEPILQRLASESLEGDSQVVEAHGLLGRIYKQRYVNANQPDSRYARAAFERALAEYLQTYRLNPQKNYWHGVNAVAMLCRGDADQIAITHAPNPAALARDILEMLRNQNDPDPFDLATRAEARLALGRCGDPGRARHEYAEAEKALLEYSQHEKTDAFEAASTLRQFEEVWQLHDDEAPGNTLLPILRAARMRGEHGILQTTPEDVDKEIARVKEAQTRLESNFGFDSTRTLKWYLTGLERTKSVARMENLGGTGKGTGWLVRAEDFFPKEKLSGLPAILLLTNAHVINPEGTGALKISQAVANFQGLKKTFNLDKVVWSSPPSRLDATFIAIKDDPPAAEAMPLWPDAVDVDVPPQRLYIMGHPNGRDLEFSMHDNKLVKCIDPYLHYRTPTEPGNSGSPVFEQTDWRVVALHHAGEPTSVEGKKPPYEANEGIAVTALIAAIQASGTTGQ